MPTPPKAADLRFNNEAEVIAAIDKTLTKIVKLRVAAVRLDQKADNIYAKARAEGLEAYYSPMAIDKRERAQQKRDRADHITTHYLVHLKNKLACMQTRIMPTVLADASIPQ